MRESVNELKETGTCCLCGKAYESCGNNPWPLGNVESDRCCRECDQTLVLPARIKNCLVREILNGVPRDRLQAAIGFIWADRHRRATGQGEDAPVGIDPKLVNDVEGFMATCSVRQLKMLRKIALGLEKDTSPLQ
jgi:hypothetical protein